MCSPQLVAVTLLVAPPHLAPVPVPVPVEISGNVVLPDEVYLTVMSLGAEEAGISSEPTLDNAERLAGLVLRFLHNSGYEIAKVEPHVDDGRIILDIDEGRLTKIIFRGLGTLRTLQFKLEVSVPHRVYNRPDLARQLADLRDEYDLPEADFDLVPTDEREHMGPQLTDLGSVHRTLEAIPALPPPGDYELHIRLGRRDWRTGFHLHGTYSSTDGIKLGSSYTGLGLLFDDDRWMVRADAGVRRFPYLDRSASSTRLARGTGELRYYTPEIAATRLRPYLSAFADLRVRQRPDLGLQTVDWLRYGVLANLSYEFVDGLSASLGGGIERRQLDDIIRKTVDPEVPQPSPFVHHRWVVSGRGELLFDTQEIRLDRRHELDYELRATFASIDEYTWASRAEYQRVFALGWHDLWLVARGTALWGQVPFVDEESISRHLRGVFADRYWVKSVGSVSGEFRFSLSRDVFKLSAFADLALFEDPGKTRNRHRKRAGACVGLGFHALILDIVQVDVYGSRGAASDGNRDWGIAGKVAKAF